MRSDRRHALWTDLNCPHFISSVTQDRKRLFADHEAASTLLEEMHFYSTRYNVELIAAVVMSDHFHAIIWPHGEKTFSDYMHGVKGYMAKWYGDREVRRGAVAPPINGKSYIPKIWQDSFFDYVIESEEKLAEKIECIIRNPVEDNLVAEGGDYPYLLVHKDFDPR